MCKSANADVSVLKFALAVRQFLRALAVVAGQLKGDAFTPVAAMGLVSEVPGLRQVAYAPYPYKQVRGMGPL